MLNSTVREIGGTPPCPYDDVFFLTLHDLRVFSNENGAGIGAFVTLFIALFTWFLVDSTDKLWEEAKVQRTVNERAVSVAEKGAIEAKRSADVAEQTLIATNRPWLLTSHPEHIEEKGPVIREGMIDLPVRVSVKNVGKSPALNIYLFGITLFKFTDDDKVADLIDEWVKPIAGYAVANGKGDTLFHADSVKMRTKSSTRIPDGVSVIDEKQPWYFLVAASYIFSFSDPEPRYTATLYKVDKRATARISYEGSPDRPPDGHKFLSGNLSFKKIATYAN